MDKKLYILSVFFEKPNKKYHIRELARILKLNHTTVKNYLELLVKEEYLTKEKNKIYNNFKANINKKFKNLKLFYNLEQIRKNKIIEILEKKFEYPTIMLFGSYAQAENDENSDIDLAIISPIKKEIKINKKISLHLFNKEEWKTLKEKNPELFNNIINGITLSGLIEA